ncbi:MAG: hypothetical protein MJ107_01545 [Lachnospiraceae bacterium]|nr:hypothetical protein [Lachnospiraceae bacterium]
MRKSRASIFLMELIIVIFFFSLTAAVCLQIFVKAHILGKKTQNINEAVLLAQNAGELFYEYGEAFDEYSNLIIDEMSDNLTVELKTSKDDNFLYLSFECSAKNSSEPLYQITFKKNIQEVSQ